MLLPPSSSRVWYAKCADPPERRAQMASFLRTTPAHFRRGLIVVRGFILHRHTPITWCEQPSDVWGRRGAPALEGGGVSGVDGAEALQGAYPDARRQLNASGTEASITSRSSLRHFFLMERDYLIK